MDKAYIQDLIARLEAATEGSRELDYEIHEALGWQDNDECGWSRNGESSFPDTSWPHYTTSVDVAMTLVPEGARVRELGQWWDMDRLSGWFCNIMRWERDEHLSLVERCYTFGFADDDRMPRTAPTAALAICIACLKARQATP